MAPFMARIAQLDYVAFRVQMLSRMPLPDPLPGLINLNQNICPHRPTVSIGRAALHAPGDVIRYSLCGQIERAPGFSATTIVVLVGIAVFPHDIALPVHLNEHAILMSPPIR